MDAETKILRRHRNLIRRAGGEQILFRFLSKGLQDTVADPPNGIGFETEVCPLVVLLFCYFQSDKPSLLQFLFRQPSIKILFDDIQHYLFLIHLFHSVISVKSYILVAFSVRPSEKSSYGSLFMSQNA